MLDGGGPSSSSGGGCRHGGKASPGQATAPLARAVCTGRFVWEARTEEEECDESLSVAELLVSRAQQEQGQALQQVQLSQPQPVLSQAGAVSR